MSINPVVFVQTNGQYKKIIPYLQHQQDGWCSSFSKLCPDTVIHCKNWLRKQFCQ